MLAEDTLKSSIREWNAFLRYIPTEINPWVPLEINTNNVAMDVPTTAKIKILQAVKTSTP
jgi:hypothetical protein